MKNQYWIIDYGKFKKNMKMEDKNGKCLKEMKNDHGKFKKNIKMEDKNGKRIKEMKNG